MDILLRCFFVSTLFFSTAVFAGIKLDKTRLIYPAEKKEVLLGITNNAPTPRLIQAWIDDGGAVSREKPGATPFLIVPPIFRIDPAYGRKLRVRFVGPALPQDRESVFWINLLELQPKPTGNAHSGQNNVQISVRSRLKLFYRPQGLQGTPDKAVSALRWRRVAVEGGYALECENPSAWNISFNDLHLYAKEERPIKPIRGMCPAKGKKQFSVPLTAQADVRKIVMTTINDYGGFERHEASFSL
ncbi:fimbria/pilus periplasmic chaperone [Yokenella regensburgei]|uniref:fimbrial biogenesis chaperone n=1 Tax=Yokenella regensburgei TaxID=158877 RepID=UPI003F13B2DF